MRDVVNWDTFMSRLETADLFSAWLSVMVIVLSG